MANVIRDLPDTSSYWAAIWTMCTMPDVHVIADAPIGCFNLVATAVPDYTDAVPEIPNVTPSVIKEDQVAQEGTAPAVKRTYEGLRDEGRLDGKHLILVSTAESEMIGSNLSDLAKQLKPGTRFFDSESLSDDEWRGRDRVLTWLWETYGQAEAEGIEPEPGLVNIIGPTYGCFNSPADLHEVKRLIEGAGGHINLVYPFEARLDETPNLARGQVNVALYKEFGGTLAEALGQPWLHAPMGIRETTAFIQRLGELLGTSEQAEAFIKAEKRGTLQAVWDLWRGPQSDWFGTTSFGVVAPRSYAEGLKAFLGDELGMQVAFSYARPGDVDNHTVRQQLHENPPAFVFGSINERIYLSEAGAKHTHFIPAAFPGPIVRRAVGTPFMGYRGTVYIMQDIVNRLYDSLFSFLPLDKAAQQGAGSNGGSQTNGSEAGLAWHADAQALLDEALAKLPYLARISASRELQNKIETQARQQGLQEVTAELAASVLASQDT